MPFGKTGTWLFKNQADKKVPWLYFVFYPGNQQLY